MIVSKTDGETPLELSVHYLRCACDDNVELLGDGLYFVQTSVDVNTACWWCTAECPGAQNTKTVDDELEAMRRKA
jgi:hypothetical protein